MWKMIIPLVYFAIILAAAYHVQLKYETLRDTIEEQVKKRNKQVDKIIKRKKEAKNED